MPRSHYPTKKITSRPGAFTLVELMVVISVIGVLASLLLPALKAARDRAKAMLCLNQIRQHSIAGLGTYTADYKGSLPPALGLSPSSRTGGVTFQLYAPAVSASIVADYSLNGNWNLRSTTLNAKGDGYYSISFFELIYPDRPRTATISTSDPKYYLNAAFCPAAEGTNQFQNAFTTTGLSYRYPSYHLNAYISYPITTNAQPPILTHVKSERAQNPSNKVFLVETHNQQALTSICPSASPRALPTAWSQAVMLPVDFTCAYSLVSPTRHSIGFNVSYLDGSAKFNTSLPRRDGVGMSAGSPAASWDQSYYSWFRPDLGNAANQAEEQRTWNIFTW